MPKLGAVPELLDALPLRYTDKANEVDYRLNRSAGHYFELVAVKGRETDRLQLLWAFGSGRKGLSFVGRDFEVEHDTTKSPILRHKHPEYRVGYYRRRFRHLCIQPNVPLEIQPGEIALLNPHVSHEDLETPTEREYLEIKFKAEFFLELIDGFHSLARELPCFQIDTDNRRQQLRRQANRGPAAGMCCCLRADKRT